METKFWDNFEIAGVTLRVKDLESMSLFYQNIMGLKVIEQKSSTVSLGIDGHCLIRLIEQKNSSIPTQPRTGLYHTAFVVPDRESLAQWLLHVNSRYPITGASDHLVSEAIYLDDPEGNGIEVYRDRDSDEWNIQQGLPIMGSERLDLTSLAQEGRQLSPYINMPIGSRIGHIHLKVSDIAQTKQWYQQNLGLDVVADLGSAVFLSRNGYHHHIGANIWESLGAHDLQPNETGLIGFELNTGLPQPINLVDPNGIQITNS